MRSYRSRIPRTVNLGRSHARLARLSLGLLSWSASSSLSSSPFFLFLNVIVGIVFCRFFLWLLFSSSSFFYSRSGNLSSSLGARIRR